MSGRAAAAATARVTAAAVAAGATAVATLTAAAATAAYLVVVSRRGAVLAMTHRGSTRVILCLTLAVSGVGRQSRRRASQHEK